MPHFTCPYCVLENPIESPAKALQTFFGGYLDRTATPAAGDFSNGIDLYPAGTECPGSDALRRAGLPQNHSTTP